MLILMNGCFCLQGICGLEVRLLNRAAQVFVPRDSGESMLNSAMAGLGPKQRRLVKNLSLIDQVGAPTKT